MKEEIEILERLNNHKFDYKSEQENLELKISYRPFNQILLEERLTIVMFIVKELSNMIDNMTSVRTLREINTKKYEELIKRSISFSKNEWLEREAYIEFLKIIK